MEPLRPLELPRGLIFLGSIWLIGSWFVAIGVRSPIQPVAASYTPGVRMMQICLGVGLIVAWPLLRLSQRPSAAPVKQTLLDLSALLALVQVVVWPLRLVTPWTLSRTAAIDATLVSWLILAGAIVAASAGSRRTGPRMLGMAMCVSLAIGGPAAAWIGSMFGSDLLSLAPLSPLLGVYEISGGSGAPPTAEDWTRIIAVAIAAGAAWIVVGIANMAFRPHELGHGVARRRTG